jgi:hypothetical protein
MKNLIQAAVVTLFAASAAQAQQAVQWKVSDGGNGHWYQWSRQASGISWTAARSQCTSRGGHLATPTSLPENQFVFDLTLPTTSWLNRFGPWLGGFQPSGSPEPAGGWRWVTEEVWDCTAWWPGEPTNFYCTSPGEDKLHFIDYAANWNDITDEAGDCEGFNWSYVIEWDADCNNDGIIDYGQCRNGTLPDYDGNNIPDCCESATPCVIGNYPVQWRVADGGNGHWYQLIIAPNGIRWTDARSLSLDRGGDLACPKSEPCDSFCWNIVFVSNAVWRAVPNDCSTCASIGGPWIGGYQDAALPTYQEPAGGWKWVDGTSVDMSPTRWFDGGPNNAGGGEDFLQYWRRFLPHQWNDNVNGADRANGFLVEWSADCNNDGIVDYGQILQGQLADTNQDGVPDICQVPTCVDADLFRDFDVNGADLGILLSQWGPNTPLTVADINDDGAVDGADLGLLLSFWGACP